jgi:hypothetical protein
MYKLCHEADLRATDKFPEIERHSAKVYIGLSTYFIEIFADCQGGTGAFSCGGSSLFG